MSKERLWMGCLHHYNGDCKGTVNFDVGAISKAGLEIYHYDDDSQTQGFG